MQRSQYGMDSQAFYHSHRRQRVAVLPALFGGKGVLCRSASPCRQADNTAWIPKPFTTLIGGKGLPPYQPCSAAKGFYVGRHPHADRLTIRHGFPGLLPLSSAAKGCRLPAAGRPCFYQVNEGSNYHKPLPALRTQLSTPTQQVLSVGCNGSLLRCQRLFIKQPALHAERQSTGM